LNNLAKELQKEGERVILLLKNQFPN
jgi:hypothetical protein